MPTVKTMDLGDYDDDGGDLALVNSGAEQIRMVPESQHALMSAAMLDAKRARMKVENDREALANRIARLQAEELRATKRIEQTVRPLGSERMRRRVQRFLACLTLPSLAFSPAAAPSHAGDPWRQESAPPGTEDERTKAP